MTRMLKSYNPADGSLLGVCGIIPLLMDTDSSHNCGV